MKQIVLFLLIVLLINAAASACPNCKGLEQVVPPSSGDTQAGSLPAGFNNSIYFMLGSLFVVIGGVSFLIVRAVRSANRLAEVNAALTPSRTP